ncbi:hypothetical protein LTR10_000102 [Elasticomyces elasticus]|nr:hypothetical protein LTR10_000102 [Elasticomyces elasticus]KAK4980639.1 hypothetical protein LTR42_000947 [Elasticomyces elasticus]
MERSIDAPRSVKSPKLTYDIDEHVASAPTTRELSMTKYCNVYSDISLSTLATAFPPSYDTPRELASVSSNEISSRDEMEAEVSELIMQGMLPDHRLDLSAREGRIVSIQSGAWVRIYGDAIKAAHEVEHEMLLRLHKVNVVLAGLGVKDSPGRTWW